MFVIDNDRRTGAQDSGLHLVHRKVLLILFH